MYSVYSLVNLVTASHDVLTDSTALPILASLDSASVGIANSSRATTASLFPP